MSEPQTAQEKHLAYQRSLSRIVGEACDKWLDKKGLKTKSWKDQNDNHFKKLKKPWQRNCLSINDLGGRGPRRRVTRWRLTTYKAKKRS